MMNLKNWRRDEAGGWVNERQLKYIRFAAVPQPDAISCVVRIGLDEEDFCAGVLPRAEVIAMIREVMDEGKMRDAGFDANVVLDMMMTRRSA